jgi:hypothetical protein
LITSISIVQTLRGVQNCCIGAVRLWLQLWRCGQTGGQQLACVFKTCICHTCCYIFNKLWNKFPLKIFAL